MLDQSDAADLIGDLLFPAYLFEKNELDYIDKWYRWDHDRPHTPTNASVEYKQIADRAQTPFLHLVVTTVAQALYVEGYRTAKTADNSPAWSDWQRNGMDARQLAIHRNALAYGQSYAVVLPGTDRLGADQPLIRGVSARHGIAFWGDVDDDEYPTYFLRMEPTMLPDRRLGYFMRLYDEFAVYTFLSTASGELTYITTDAHDMQVCPVVRYANQLDLEGRTPGEVEPYIPVAARIDQTVNDRLIVQRFSSWRVRTIAGMAAPEIDDEARAEEIRLLISDMLMADDPDTKFGTLEASDLVQFITAKESDVRDLAAVSQTPAHHLVGTISNVGAEALAAADSTFNRKIDERKHSFGESHEKLLRLSAWARGDSVGASDWDSQVRWKDVESRSLAQIAAALQMISTVGVAPEMLWDRIPGWTDQDTERNKRLIKEASAMGLLMDSLAKGQMSPTPAPAGQPSQGTVPPSPTQ